MDKKVIFNYIEKNKSITRKDLENILSIEQTMAGRVLKELMDDREIRKVGRVFIVLQNFDCAMHTVSKRILSLNLTDS